MFKKDGKTDITPIITGVAGVVAGAAAATLLSNEDNRKKVAKHLNTIKKKTVQTLKDMSNDAMDRVEETTEKTQTAARKYIA